jgi:hypothetical protein
LVGGGEEDADSDGGGEDVEAGSDVGETDEDWVVGFFWVAGFFVSWFIGVRGAIAGAGV